MVATRSFSKTPPFLPISHQTSSSSTSSSSSSPNILDQQQQQQQQQTQEAIQSKEHKSLGNNNTNKKSSSSSSSSSFSNMMRKWTRMGSKSSPPANTSSCLSIPASTSSRNANGANFYCNDNPSFDRSSPTNGLYEDIHPPLTSQSSLHHHHHSSSSSHTRSGSCPARTTTSCKGFSPPTNRPLPAIPPPPPSSSSSRRKERYRAIARYPPNSDFELELEEGDVVIVHKKREDGWIKGTLVKNGKTGLFPKSFVELIPSE